MKPANTEPIDVVRVTGDELTASLDAVARLRIEVFRDFPYLYDGTAAYERDYLAEYAGTDGGVVVLAKHGDEVIGAATGMPLAEADAAFREPFLDAGVPVAEWFYFGESVLRPAFRGQGIGHRFFDEREAHARALGFRRFAFCAVVRPPDHPLRPPRARTHDHFWTKRGFHRRDDLVARLPWKQVDTDDEVTNELVFWLKEEA